MHWLPFTEEQLHRIFLFLIFAALAGLSLYLGRQWLNRNRGQSDEPNLNQRGASLVGRTADLIDPIHNGRGKVKIGDTIWIVSGPDLPLGTRVRVVSSDGSDLRVEAG